MTDEHKHAMKVWREANIAKRCAEGLGPYCEVSPDQAAAAVIAADRAGLVARVAELEKLARTVRDFLLTAPLESGVCCCGDPVEGHGYGSGHSPVDDLAYYAGNLANEISAALKDTRHEHG